MLQKNNTVFYNKSLYNIFLQISSGRKKKKANADFPYSGFIKGNCIYNTENNDQEVFCNLS